MVGSVGGFLRTWSRPHWATDAPGGIFEQILDQWKGLFKGRPPLLEMEKFLYAHCPEWAEWGMRQLRERKR